MRKKTSFRLLSGIALLLSLTLGACTETITEDPIEKTPETRALLAFLAGSFTESRWGGELAGPQLESDGVLYTNKNYSFSYKPLGAIGAGRIWTGTSIGLRKVGAPTYNPEYYNTSEGMESNTVKMDYTFPEPGQYELKGNKSYSWTSSGLKFKVYEGEIYASRKYTVILPPITNIQLNGPDEPIEIGTPYQMDVTYDVPEGVKPVFDFTAINRTLGNTATITRISNTSANIVFNTPGEYEMKASFKTDPTKSATLVRKVYSNEILITHNSLNTYTDCRINAFYSTEADPDPSFKFSIISTPGGKPGTYSIKKSAKDNIDICFYASGEYTLRAEVEGKPEIYKNHTFQVAESTLPAEISIAPTLAEWNVIPPGSPASMRMPYRLHLSYRSPISDEGSPHKFVIKELLFGNVVTVFQSDNQTDKPPLDVYDRQPGDITFTDPGEYIIEAIHTATNTVRATRPISVYSENISITQYRTIVFDKGVYSFGASYYSEEHPNPTFTFFILRSPLLPVEPDYEIQKVGKNKIDFLFYRQGEYTLQVQIEGAPLIIQRHKFTVTTVADRVPIRPIDPFEPFVPIEVSR